MTLAELKSALASIDGFENRVAYRAFPVGAAPELPFICYVDVSTDNFMADNQVYAVIYDVDVELYTQYKDPATESLVEACLKGLGIAWNKSDEYIDSENMYEILYSFSIQQVY
jgi:hypothetical protein